MMNIFSEAVTDLTFFAVSYLNIKHNIDILNPNKIYQTILDNEIINGLPNEICEKYKLKFDLLSDESDKICEKFGVWIKKSMYGRTYKGIDRSTFLIMRGKVVKVWRKVKVNNHVEEVIDTIKQMNK